MRGVVVLRFAAISVHCARLQEFWRVFGLDIAGIGAAAMQKGAASPVNFADSQCIEWQRVFFNTHGIVQIEVEQASPASANTQHRVTGINQTQRRCFDGGVKARHIATTGQYSYFHVNRFTPAVLQNFVW